jgi:hypothetical protein
MHECEKKEDRKWGGCKCMKIKNEDRWGISSRMGIVGEPPA